MISVEEGAVINVLVDNANIERMICCQSSEQAYDAVQADPRIRFAYLLNGDRISYS